MKLFKSLMNFERKVPLAIFGLILSILALIYTEFIKDSSPRLLFEVKSATRILEVKEDVEDLKILLGDRDIRSLNKTLSVILLDLRNTSSVPVLKEHFDPADPIALHIVDGQIMKLYTPAKINHKNFVNRILIERDKLIFPNVIIHGNEKILLKILVLHDENVVLKFSSSGKLAYQSAIPVVDASLVEEKSFFSRVYSGTAGVQIARAFIYTFLFMLFLFFISYPFIKTYSSIQKLRRKRHVELFKASYTNFYKNIEKKQLAILIYYIKRSLIALEMLEEVLESNEKIHQMLNYEEAFAISAGDDPDKLFQLEEYNRAHIGQFLKNHNIDKVDERLVVFLKEFKRSVHINNF